MCIRDSGSIVYNAGIDASSALLQEDVLEPVSYTHLVRSQLALVELMRLVMRLEISVMVIKKLWLLVGQKLVLLHLVLEAFHQ